MGRGTGGIVNLASVGTTMGLLVNGWLCSVSMYLFSPWLCSVSMYLSVDEG